MYSRLCGFGSPRNSLDLKGEERFINPSLLAVDSLLGALARQDDDAWTDVESQTIHSIHLVPAPVRDPSMHAATRQHSQHAALYGNSRTRYEFPPLGSTPNALRPCSVCARAFEDLGKHRVWITALVGTDVLPLLVNACSESCIEQLPTPAENHVSHPHRGGPAVVQPRAADWAAVRQLSATSGFTRSLA